MRLKELNDRIIHLYVWIAQIEKYEEYPKCELDRAIRILLTWLPEQRLELLCLEARKKTYYNKLYKQRKVSGKRWKNTYIELCPATHKGKWRIYKSRKNRAIAIAKFKRNGWAYMSDWLDVKGYGLHVANKQQKDRHSCSIKS